MFYHSLLSDWNHGNAHFLRGVAYEMVARGTASAFTRREMRGACAICSLTTVKGLWPASIKPTQALRACATTYRRLISTKRLMERTWCSSTNGMTTTWCGA